tara:strand:- start:502 stop:810 length:309 start_codon:yes stop_codon:yes gene_type:complete
MKMVLVFDTEDVQGMRTSMKMMRHILQEYGTQWNSSDPQFGKIELIKMLRDFTAFRKMRPCEAEDGQGNKDISLKHYKEFMDYVFKTKEAGEYYKTKWRAGT